MAELRVSVCYAHPGRQFLTELRLPEGALLKDALLRSGLLEEAPEIDLPAAKVGIFGKARQLDTPLRDGDRVEVYRPLIADPKESRRRRAVKKGRPQT
ncbi:MAG TPA: RnfH family protein [Noviherbaspirillum sp.]|jgi:putative ubiquitin-RnfH superfamily antitoxin RatB of RatAB toxin-antitoxin module|uniref:RnfH family protein n=1 Tax=Noviherbaspirillum sp. TaxID=1926288 RepID=UPI002F934575